MVSIWFCCYFLSVLRFSFGSVRFRLMGRSKVRKHLNMFHFYQNGLRLRQRIGDSSGRNAAIFSGENKEFRTRSVRCGAKIFASMRPFVCRRGVGVSVTSTSSARKMLAVSSFDISKTFSFLLSFLRRYAGNAL